MKEIVENIARSVGLTLFSESGLRHYAFFGSPPSAWAAALVVDANSDSNIMLRFGRSEPMSRSANEWFEACIHEISHFVQLKGEDDADSAISDLDKEIECYHISLGLVERHAPETLVEYIHTVLENIDGWFHEETVSSDIRIKDLAFSYNQKLTERNDLDGIRSSAIMRL